MQVDEEIRQRGSTKDMIFKIPFLISYISSTMTLFEGDVILTGIAMILLLLIFISEGNGLSLVTLPFSFPPSIKKEIGGERECVYNIIKGGLVQGWGFFKRKHE